MLKLAELESFFGRFWPSQKMFLALRFEPLDQTKQNFQFNKHKIFPTSGQKGNSMQGAFSHFRVQEMAKTWCKLYLNWPIATTKLQYLYLKDDLIL